MKFNKIMLLFGISFVYLSASCLLNVSLEQKSDGRSVVKITKPKGCEIIIKDGGETVIISPLTGTDTKPVSTVDTNESNNTLVESIISLAKSKIGNRYQPSGSGPDHFDCSGFIYWLHKTNGIDIPRVSRNQAEIGKHLKKDELQRGDLVFFDTANRGHVNHSGLYLGDGKFIHSSSGKAYGVTISDLNRGFYKNRFKWGVRSPAR